MGSKSITISDDAYKYLKAMKRQEQSFSDVILALKARKDGLLKYWGSLKDADLASIQSVREDFNKDFERRQKHHARS